MNLTNLVEKRKIKNSEMRNMVQESQELCEFFFKNNYTYSHDEAIAELGVDAELINQLLEDYVTQTITSNIIFHKFLFILQEERKNSEKLDYTPLRNLVHKNLGVARNLRIKDSEQVLNDLMKKDDLADIEILLEILEACAIKLKPTKAYDTLQLIKTQKKLSQ